MIVKHFMLLTCTCNFLSTSYQQCLQKFLHVEGKVQHVKKLTSILTTSCKREGNLSSNTNARLLAFALFLALDPTFGIHSHKTIDTALPRHLLKPNCQPSSSHSSSAPFNISTQFLRQLFLCACMCMCVCACMCFPIIIPYVTECIVCVQGHDTLTFSFLSSFLFFYWAAVLWP